MSVILRAVLGLLPASRTKNALLVRAGRGWTISRNASIGPCVLWRVEKFVVVDGASVGFGNIFRDLRAVRIGAEARIGQFNWFSAAGRIFTESAYAEYRAFALDAQGAVTSRHYFDCSGGISIGQQTTIAGVRSTFMTHGPDIMTSQMGVAPIRIGESCFVAAAVTVVKGCAIADRVLVGAGSVVTSDLPEREAFYAGTPARLVKSLGNAAYFGRTGMRIDPSSSRPLRDQDAP